LGFRPVEEGILLTRDAKDPGEETFAVPAAGGLPTGFSWIGSRYELARLPESANARRAFGDFAQLRKANS
jgi:hypothetical protein